MKVNRIILIIILATITAIMMCGCFPAGINQTVKIAPKEVIAVVHAVKDSLTADTLHFNTDSVQVFTKTRENDHGKTDTMYVAKYYPITKTLTVVAPADTIRISFPDTVTVTQ